MGPGHFGIGLAAKAAAPKAPLWAVLAASEVLDLLSFAFMAVGIEKMGVTQTDFGQGIKVITLGWVPWSHGLLMSLVWSLLVAAMVYLLTKLRRTSAILGLVVFSHWPLDFIVHPPDLPLLLANSLKVGLGLWTSGPGLIASMFLEGILLGGGLAVYLAWRKRKVGTPANPP
ncbi:MAG: hypothetical protein MUO62_07840 [Anaerolineales bacterium]|nr:hypothetical protein [Anaerolineales bacterium]